MTKKEDNKHARLRDHLSTVLIVISIISALYASATYLINRGAEKEKQHHINEMAVETKQSVDKINDKIGKIAVSVAEISQEMKGMKENVAMVRSDIKSINPSPFSNVSHEFLPLNLLTIKEGKK